MTATSFTGVIFPFPTGFITGFTACGVALAAGSSA